MNKRKARFQPKWLVAILMSLCLIFGLSQMAAAADRALGDIPLDPDTYQRYLKPLPPDKADGHPLASYDARNDGIVTPAKDQGYCGSCWAFASVGAMESHLLKTFGFGPTDLSEQQQNSCNTSMSGCCGGNSTAPQFWQTTGPVYESCFPYGDYNTSCPTTSVIPCSNGASCEQLPTRVVNFYTVEQDQEGFKHSLYDDGPSYWRFDVYSDFSYSGTGFWYDAGPGDVYVNQSGSSRRGGHAVLIIGWDDSKGAYLCKNSWGATGGPNGDGTFWIAYTGHYYNLGFAMSNFNIEGNPQECDYCFEDSAGYVWCLNVIDDIPWPYLFLAGTVDMGFDFRTAVATYNGYNCGIKFTVDRGTGVPFNYNFKFNGPVGEGVWINVTPTAGHGSIAVYLCGAAGDSKAEIKGPRPGDIK